MVKVHRLSFPFIFHTKGETMDKLKELWNKKDENEIVALGLFVFVFFLGYRTGYSNGSVYTMKRFVNSMAEVRK